MINFIKIENVYDPNFGEVYDLYNTSFPSYSRRSWAGLETVFNKKQAFNSVAVKKDSKFVGLIHYWIFDKFVYIEQFAIHPDYRNAGLGTKVMKEFLKKHELPIVIETETPRTQIASKRIYFYERVGFYMISNFYMQPPYEGSQVLMSMLIMTNDYNYVNKYFQQIKNTIYKEVYKYDPKKR
ncbi:MAG: GNAT family N-acetyltransferase [Paludibacter sp.]